MARPKNPKHNINLMCRQIDEYLESRKFGVPILKECCLLNDWDYLYFMELCNKNPALAESKRKILNWKEIRLEQGALTGSLDKTMSIFSLKQLGWRDKVEDDTDKTTIDLLTSMLEEVKKQSEIVAQTSGIYPESE